MAYGIVSIIAYLIFLIWVVATYDQGNDSTPYKPFGAGVVTLAAAMGQAFSIQSFFIPVLKKNENPSKYTFYTMLAYIIGGLAYYYIAYMGSIGTNPSKKVSGTGPSCPRNPDRTQSSNTSAATPGKSTSSRPSTSSTSTQCFLSSCSSASTCGFMQEEDVWSVQDWRVGGQEGQPC